jgi:hypothetical protein
MKQRYGIPMKIFLQHSQAGRPRCRGLPFFQPEDSNE